MVIEKAYAKINLTLDVINKREDGYHELKSIMSPLSLCDELIFEDYDDIVLEDNFNIKDNIILKAAHLLKEEYNVEKGAKIKLIKRIPIEAGLAGGSADASATLRGLNKLWGLGLKINELAKLSEKLGSDTIFCTYNRLAYVSGRGEKISFIPSNIDTYCLLIKPYFGVSTKKVFENHIINYKGTGRFEDCLKSIDSGKKIPVYNDLLGTTLEIYPELKDLFIEVQKYNKDVMMSGSGPTLYVLSNDRIHLNNLYRKFVSSNICFICKLGLFE